jgi:hypothetical protein
MAPVGQILNEPIFGVVYCTTNTLDGMKYIGQKKYIYGQGFYAYLGSGIRLSNAIAKYGREHFVKEILCECYSKEEMDDMEQYYIDYYNAVKSPLFYNLAKGGDGGDMSHVKQYKKVCQYNLDGTLVAVFDSAKEAERAVGYSNKIILKNCWGQKNKCKEFMFRFYEDTKGEPVVPYVSTKGKWCIRKVAQYTTGGAFIQEYPSLGQAEKSLGISNISATIRGKQKTAGGFVWKYVN